MKTLFKTLVLGIFLTAFSAVAFGQEPDLATLFEKFKQERKAACGQRDAALATGKTILEKFGNDTDNPDVIKFVRDNVAKIEKEDPACKKSTAEATAYNDSYKAKDWAKFVTISKEIIAREGNSPLALDVMLTLVSVGYDEAVKKVDTHNVDTINYAKQAIQRIEAGGTSSTGNWGVYAPFKTKDFPDGKTNSLNWMNYIIGWINYNRLGTNDENKKKEGLVYLYKSTLVNGEMKTDHTIYTNIGNYYFDKAATLDEEYRKIRATNNNIDTDESKAKLALARGFADRSIDAFGRARQIATQNNKKPVADIITKKLGELYRFRFNIAATAPTPDLEKYVSGLLAKPMPDPATDVTPVIEEVAPATTTTTSNATTTTPAANVTTSTTSTTKETPAKKPVTKKKGTR